MLDIFYAPKTDFTSSAQMLKKILNERFSVFEYEIYKSENGKPFLSLKKQETTPLFFSVSHTDTAYFIAFSNENIGIDAEPLSRKTNYAPILKKFAAEERNFVQNDKDFLLLWTAKESAIKWLDGTIAKDLKKLTYVNKMLTLNGLQLPLKVYEFEFFEHVITVCKETATLATFHKL